MSATELPQRLVVMPLLDDSQIGPASIDLRLGTEFIEMHRLERKTLDPVVRDEPLFREEKIVVPLGEDLILHPGQFILGATLEFLGMPLHLCGEVLNRSSWARLGLLVASAVFVVMRLPDKTELNYSHKDAKYRAPLSPQSSRLRSEAKEWDRLLRIGAALRSGQAGDGD